jgi:hypothetical protein
MAKHMRDGAQVVCDSCRNPQYGRPKYMTHGGYTLPEGKYITSLSLGTWETMGSGLKMGGTCSFVHVCVFAPSFRKSGAPVRPLPVCERAISPAHGVRGKTA